MELNKQKTTNAAKLRNRYIFREARDAARNICDAFGMTYPGVGFLGAKHWDDVADMVQEAIEECIPTQSGRHENKARELLGKVYRHKTNPPEEWPEIGVVEVGNAIKQLSYYVALAEHWMIKADEGNKRGAR